MHTRRESTMKWTLLAGCLLLLVASTAQAQFLPAPAPPPESEKGEVKNGYEIHQSIEFGGYISDFDGNESLWDTFVNQHTGPRLLGFTLDMHSVDHSNLLFDELHSASFGYGGDPNNWTRLRVSKSRIYDFSASFRRNRNYWDYNLLANPLNPPTSVPNDPVEVSPHRFQVVRRMTDLNLTILPQSKVRFRLGYSRNVSEGPSNWTVHEGTDTVLDQFWRNGLDTYRAGVDFQFIPRTTFSYDQFWSFYKGDIYWVDTNHQFQLNALTPSDLGIVFNTGANQPCAPPVIVGGFTAPACNQFLEYARFQKPRGEYPVEQFSFQSNYWKPVDLSGRFSYSSSDSNVPFDGGAGWGEFYDGFTSRSRTRIQTTTGPTTARRVNANADFGLTWHITDKLNFVDSFRWTNFRIPGNWMELQSTLFAANAATVPNTFDPLTCPGAPATCPQHSANSGADLLLADRNRFLGQQITMNTVELEYAPWRQFGGSLGYRYRHRDIDVREFDLYTLTFFPTLPNRGACAGQPLNPDGSCTVLTFNGTSTTDVVPSFTGLEPESEKTEINEHSLLFGLWFRPARSFTARYDMEWMYADNVFTRISPRQLQQVRLRVNWEPAPWANVSASINIRENRNNVETVENKQHNHAYNLGVTVMPRDAWSLDFGYSYQDIFSATNICFVATPVPPGTLTCGAPFLEDVSFYSQKVQFFSFGAMWRPIKRVTTQVGYTGTFARGDTLILNPISPLGPLDYRYHLPVAGIRVELAPRWSVAGGWNYYGYNEKGEVGPTVPRDFKGNVGTLGVRYAF